MDEYDKWVKDPTPDNLANVVKALDPVITSEIQRFSGPKPLLRGKARELAIRAIKTYRPTEGARLQSWVVTQLQPLSRYSQHLRPIRVPEVAIRQAAEVNRIRSELVDETGEDPTDEELADRVGISVRRIRNVRKMARPVVFEGATLEPTADGVEGSAPGVSVANKLVIVEDAVYDSLSPRDKAIFDWKTGKHGKAPIDNAVIARRLGLTPAAISQRSRAIAERIQDLYSRQVL